MDDSEKSTILSCAAKYGHIHVIDDLMCSCTQRCTHSSTHNACYVAIEHNQLPFFAHIVQRLRMEGLANISMEITTRMASFNRLNMMNWWLQKGGLVCQGSVDASVKRCCNKTLSWFLQNKYYPSSSASPYMIGKDIAGCWNVSIKQVHQTLALLHKYNSPGAYRIWCKSGKCRICKIDKLADMWEMDAFEFDFIIQWLPREITNDLFDLLVSSH